MSPIEPRSRPVRSLAPVGPVTVGPIDTPPDGSVSFPPPETFPAVQDGQGRAPVAVGPGRAVAALPASGPLRDVVNGFPIQIAKVQRPALSDETLERPRLLDWLRAKTTGRVVLLLADAGFGKTTLLADFSRRSRMRTLWYRLDHEDRDWTALLHHLVAAGREHEPGFAPATAALLAEVGVGGPSREQVLETFLRELPTIVDERGALIVLDDFHLVDDAVDARHIAHALVAEAPERTCVVFASRRVPTVTLAKLRSVGEVAELATDDLRFDLEETERLFNSTYGRSLEADLIEDLSRRTEGWVASLQMVHNALRDRSGPAIRAFVRDMTGADRELYDYLAEEVVGDLPPSLQRFLMETSILQVVTPELARIAMGLPEAEIADLTLAAERTTLLTRRTDSPRTHRRYHPLVREFLESRLRTGDGVRAVQELHRRVADATYAADWRLGVHHYREAGDAHRMIEVLGDAIPTIMGNGQYSLAASFIDGIDPADRPASLALVTSRVDMQQGDYQAAIEASEALLEIGLDEPAQRDHALLNLITMHLNLGDGAKATAYAESLMASTSDPYMRAISKAAADLVGTADSGNLDAFTDRLRALLKLQLDDRLLHLGVTLLNLGTIALLQDQSEPALDYAARSIEALAPTSGRLELGNAVSTQAEAHARRGQLMTALDDLAPLQSEGVIEAVIQLAQIADSYTDGARVPGLLEDLSGRRIPSRTDRDALHLVKARHLIRARRFPEARLEVSLVDPHNSTDPGAKSALAATIAYAAVASRERSSLAAAQHAFAVADAQQAHAWARISRVLMGAATDDVSLSRTVAAVGVTSPWVLTYLADVLVARLHLLDAQALAETRTAAHLHPGRWRVALRQVLDGDASEAIERAGQFLEQIGEREDIRRLRRIAKARRGNQRVADLGRTLARRLAHTVRFEDQGRVTVEVDGRHIAGSQIRRKVLALACFLLSRPRMSCTRDQVLDALWPMMDPEDAANSLNQTVYFLRRVFEPDYVEDESPGYLNHDSEVVWFDSELISSRSNECRSFMRSLPAEPSPAEVDQLLAMYLGKFALDFEYEEWAEDHRNALHTGFLEIVERAVQEDMASGNYDRGIRVAQAGLEVEPSADQIEVTLLRLLRLTGAHAAAAEQYEHYTSVMRREVGIDPPPLETL
ncbi:MAG: BTAD domain-containing putative transcriptional regulator [Candidatus Limnocylindria bacterium]